MGHQLQNRGNPLPLNLNQRIGHEINRHKKPAHRYSWDCSGDGVDGSIKYAKAV